MRTANRDCRESLLLSILEDSLLTVLLEEFSNIAEPFKTDHSPLPLLGVFPESMRVSVHSVTSFPAFELTTS